MNNEYSNEQIKSALQFSDRMNELVARHREKEEKKEKIRKQAKQKGEK